MNIVLLAPNAAQLLCRHLTKDLPESFGIEEANEQYAQGVMQCTNFAAHHENQSVGLLSVDFPYPCNVRIYWMAVLGNFQRKGIGRQLMQHAFAYMKKQGAHTMTVETLSPQEADPSYLKTYRFYESLGFESLFDLKPAGYEWNMVYMLKVL